VADFLRHTLSPTAFSSREGVVGRKFIEKNEERERREETQAQCVDRPFRSRENLNFSLFSITTNNSHSNSTLQRSTGQYFISNQPLVQTESIFLLFHRKRFERDENSHRLACFLCLNSLMEGRILI
jgi:hypothetical protein